jgi:regulatory protein
LTGSDQARDCYLAALRLLTGQDHTALALQRKLKLRKFSSDDVQAAVEQLSREGYLNDQRYAERFIAAARESGRFTGYRLRQELQRLGIASEQIDALLREVPDRDDELEHARSLVSRRYSGFDPLVADDRERRRVTAFLQRRGYQFETIKNLFTIPIEQIYNSEG